MKDYKEKNALFRASHMMILITYSAMAAALTLESFLLGWEKWALILLGLAVVFCWTIHIQQLFSDKRRLAVYVILMLITSFYYGIHITSTFDLSLVMCGVIILCTTTGERRYVTLCQITYFAALVYDIIAILRSTPEEFDSLVISRTALHIFMIIVVGFLARTIIDRWTQVLDHSKREVDDLTEATKRLNDFLTSVSHEIRTPINAVRGLSGICLERTDDSEQQEDLRSIQAAGKRMTELIGEILDYSDIVRHSVAVNCEDYMISSVLHDLVMELTPYFRDGTELIIDVDPAIPAVMNTDVNKLKTILWHLVTNALKFTKEGGVYVRITSEPRDYGINLRFEIADTGGGMSEEVLDSLFVGNYHADYSTTRSNGGLGLGMEIVRGFVAALDGFMPMESRLGEGTNVRVCLPQKVVDASSCMSVRNRESLVIGGYLHFEKYSNPMVRDYYNRTVKNIVRGLGVKMHRVDKLEDLQKLMDTIKLTHLFVGEEEYKTDVEYMEQLARTVTVTVVAGRGFELPAGSKAHITEKPFYCFPVAVILNREPGEVLEERYMYCRGVKALVVDDEPLNITVARDILRRYGINVTAVYSGKDAVETCSHETFDIIFMDHMMPGMDGIEAMRRIRSGGYGSAKSIPIVALTANAGSIARETFRTAGFDGFVAKPIDTQELERALRTLLPKTAITYEDAPHSRSETAARPAKEAVRPVASADRYAPMRSLGVNIEQGLVYCRNDDDFYRELIDQFAAETDGKRSEMDGLLEAGDLPGYSIRIHALKSTAKMIGADRLSEKSKALEEASKNGLADKVRALHPSAMSEYVLLKEAIFETLGKKTGAGSESASSETETDDGVLEFIPDGTAPGSVRGKEDN
ncbi:MAG: response regulator [Clostridia bacterium]|nr:response regulator [Clostridia bacterium]